MTHSVWRKRLALRAYARVVARYIGAIWFAGAAELSAQELEPRSYSPAPTGTTFVIGGFGRSQGPILMDPSLDVDNVLGDL